MKVKVLLECEVGGTLRSPGDVLEHPEELVSALISEGKLEVIPEADSAAGQTTAAPETATAPETAAAEVAPEAVAPASEVAPEAQAAPARVIAQADLDINPVLSELGAVVGDTVSIAHA